MRKVWTARVGSAGNWRIVGEQDERASTHLGFAIELIDFGAMEQKFAHSFG